MLVVRLVLGQLTKLALGCGRRLECQTRLPMDSYEGADAIEPDDHEPPPRTPTMHPPARRVIHSGYMARRRWIRRAMSTRPPRPFVGSRGGGGRQQGAAEAMIASAVRNLTGESADNSGAACLVR
jgi:hypothetical protein